MPLIPLNSNYIIAHKSEYLKYGLELLLRAEYILDRIPKTIKNEGITLNVRGKAQQKHIYADA